MYLKLTHHRFHGEGARSLAAEAPLEGAYESPAFKRVYGRLSRAESSNVLELGVLNGETISALGSVGARVHVHDVMTPIVRRMREATFSPAHVIRELSFAPGVLDAILAWELLAFLPHKEGREVLSRMTPWLAPKGLVMAVFHHIPVPRLHRFRVLGTEQVQLGMVTELPSASVAYSNSEVISLFDGFTILHSSIVRNQIREVLAQKNVA